MRVNWDEQKSLRLKRERGFSFDDAMEMFRRPYVIQHKNDVEVRYDDEGEYEWFVTLWKATASEVKIYEEDT